MKYIKNNLDYAVSFSVMDGTKEKKFEFDCRRIYSDTGNVATTGVTAMEDADFDCLYKNCKQFKAFFDKGDLSKTSKEGANAVANKVDELTKENEKLKKQLAQKQKEASGEKTAELEAKNKKQADEISDLKKQLEALKKAKKGGKADDKGDETPADDKGDETEGF